MVRLTIRPSIKGVTKRLNQSKIIEAKTTQPFLVRKRGGLPEVERRGTQSISHPAELRSAIAHLYL